jgi:hypothetical protein
VGAGLMDALGGPVQTIVGFLLALAAALTALREIWRKGIKPAVTVMKLLIHRWEDLGRVVVIAATVDEIKVKVDGIERDIAPNNGDRRSISDRHDSVRHDVREMRDDQHLVRDKMFELQRNQSAISDDVQTIRERQEQHRGATEIAAKAAEATAAGLKHHDKIDERNFKALAAWSAQFREFEPIEIEPYDDVDDGDVEDEELDS